MAADLAQCSPYRGQDCCLVTGSVVLIPRPGYANSIAPGKRPLHNMGPMLALRNDAPFATYGIPGGRTIPNNQLSISVNLIDLQMTAQEALRRAPRTQRRGRTDWRRRACWGRCARRAARTGASGRSASRYRRTRSRHCAFRRSNRPIRGY